MKDPKFRPGIVRSTPGNHWAVNIEPEAVISGVEIFGTVWVGFASYMNRGQIRGYGEIGRYCSIGRDVSIGLGIHDLEQASTSPFFAFPPTVGPYEQFASQEPLRRTIIGNDVWIGDGVRVNSGVTIGDGAVIATGAVVVKNVEPYSIVGGIPARHLKWRFTEDIRWELSRLRWWNYDPAQIKKILAPDPVMAVKSLSENVDSISEYPRSHTTIRSKKPESAPENRK